MNRRHRFPNASQVRRSKNIRRISRLVNKIGHAAVIGAGVMCLQRNTAVERLVAHKKGGLPAPFDPASDGPNDCGVLLAPYAMLMSVPNRKARRRIPARRAQRRS
jgi:hypothetical protein